MSIDIYSGSDLDVHHVYRPPELLLSTWCLRAAAALVLGVLMFIAESLYSLLVRRGRLRLTWDSDEGGEYIIDSNGYRNFIRSEMRRIQRVESGSRGGGNGRGITGGNTLTVMGDDFRGRDPRIEVAQKTGQSPPDWGSHSGFFRPLSNGSSTVLRRLPLLQATQHFSTRSRNSIRFYSPNVSPLYQSPSSRHENMCRIPITYPQRPPSENRSNINLRNAAISYNLARPGSLPTTPTRRFKPENSPTPCPISPLSTISSPSPELDGTPSPASTLPTSPPPYRSPTPLPLPRVHCPGDLVFRRRPTSSILLNTVDETDPWDGPFKVLGSTLQNWVELLLPEGSTTPSWTAIADTMYATGSQAKDVEAVTEINRNGTKRYMIGKLHGVRGVNGRGKTRKEYLVHWRGWGCEDDTWEPERGLPKEFIEDFEKRKREWEQRKRI